MLAWIRRLFRGAPAPAPTTLPTDLLIATLALPNPERRRVAETILRQHPDSACPALEEAVRRSPNQEVQKAALPLLAELGGPEATDAVIRAFDLDPPLRGSCVQAFSTLLRRHGPACAERLRAVLDDPSPERVYLVKQVQAVLEEHGMLDRSP